MKLIAEVYTPDSILNDSANYVPITVGQRPRIATCTSVCWLNDNIIASLNLFGNTITIFEHDKIKNEFKVLNHISNDHGLKLSMSEHMCISNNRKLIAVCSAPPLYVPTPKACVNIYRYDPVNNLINPIPIFSIEEDHLIHNVRFSHDDKNLSYICYDPSKAINTFQIVDEGLNGFDLKPIQIKPNEVLSLQPKAINYTSDGKFAIVCYCISLIYRKEKAVSSLISYKILTDGSLSELPASIFNHDFGMEDIVWSKDESHFFVSDQLNDLILKYSFNKETGSINFLEKFNPDSSLGFPHGMSVSADGKYLCVANYGQDKFNVYEV